MGCPLLSFDVRRQKVYPPLSALLSLALVEAHPAVDLPGYLLPLLSSSLTHKLSQHGVLLKGPRDFLRLLLVLTLPLVVTLVVVASGDQPRYRLPIRHRLKRRSSSD